MVTIEDLQLIEEGSESIESAYKALQRAINDGQAWKMQGSFGRGMMDAIRSGRCMLGPEAKFDYYGNIIPGRGDVIDGTKGSRGFVVDQCGEEWAAMLEGCDARQN